MPTPQVPIGSGFGPATTASDVIRGSDLTNKVAIVTGGYTGIGLETTRAFLGGGAKVIVPARDQAKATNALITLENCRERPKGDARGDAPRSVAAVLRIGFRQCRGYERLGC